MANYKHPGIYVDENLTPSNAIPGANLNPAAFVGPNFRGPNVPTLINSWTDYVNLYGGFGPTNQGVSYNLPFAVFSYYNNGGRSAWISRSIGTGAITSTLIIKDSAGVPLNTLTVNAISPGSWANLLSIDIANTIIPGGAIVSGRFDLVVRYPDATDGSIVERWTSLSMNPADPRYAPAVINSVTAGSNFITVVDNASATAAPNNAPAAVNAAPLATGADGAVPTPAQTSTAINALDVVQDGLTINLPGETTTANVITAINYAAARSDSFVVVDVPANSTPTTAITFQQTLPVSSYCGLYYPNIFIADPSSNTPGATRKIAPGGSVIGLYSQTDTARGVFKAAAGLNARIAGAVAVESKLVNNDLDVLQAGQVNAIRQLVGSGIVVFGARTLNTSDASRYIPVRRTLNYIKRTLLDQTRYALFEPNDQVLWASLQDNVSNFLVNLWQQGGLRGSSPQSAFYVKCDGSLNTPAVIQNGEVRVEIGVALQYPAEFVVIRIGQFEGGSTVTGG